PLWLKLVGCGCVACYGMLAAIARLATNGLWLPIGIHFAWNLLEGFVFGFPDSGIPSPDGLLHPIVTGPALLTGGDYGPAGGLVMLVLAGVAGALILALKPSRGAGPAPRGRATGTPRSPRPRPDPRWSTGASAAGCGRPGRASAATPTSHGTQRRPP